MPNAITYSIPVKIFFWLFWVIGLLAVLLFGLFAFITASGDPYFPKGWGFVAWDIFILATSAFLLVKTARHFFKADAEGSVLVLWAACAAILVPLIGFGGCLLPEMWKV